MKPEILAQSRGRSSVFQCIRIGLRSTVARNAASLYLLEFANYIVPLVTVPYLVRVLGPAGYGAVAFAQGFINYLMLFVEYGFNWSATRKISVRRDDHETMNRITFHVWAAKGLLSLLGLAILLLLTAALPKLREVYTLLLALYGIVLGNVMFPTWLFQGMERMLAISVINLGVRIAVLAGVFTLVDRPGDTVVYAALIGAGSLTAGLVGAMTAVRIFSLKCVSVTRAGVWEALKEGWVLFLSMASVGLYTAGNPFILGILTNHTVVGYYSVAEKIVKAMLGILAPLSQAAYPRFSKLAVESKEEAIFWGRRMLLLMGGTGFGLSVVIFLTAPLIVGLLLGPQYRPSIMAMKIISFLPFLVALSNVLGIQIMVPFGMERGFTLILFAAGLLNVSLAVLLVPRWQAAGMAFSVLISEIFVTLAMSLSIIYGKSFLWGRMVRP